MIQYPAVWTLSCSFSTAFWLPNIRKENLLTPGCIMAPNCLCIKPCCLDAPSRSSKPTMVSSRSPLKPTELPWSFMFWLPVLFFCIESCLWKTLFPSAFSSLLLENEFDLSSMALLVFPFSGGFSSVFSLRLRVPSPAREREREGGGEREDAPRALLFLLMSFKLFGSSAFNASAANWDRVAENPVDQVSWVTAIYRRPPASAVQSLCLISLRTTLRFNWHMLLHLIYIMWLTIPPTSVSSPLLCQQFHTRQGEAAAVEEKTHVWQVNEGWFYYFIS